jgi:hypothetical protein
MEIHHKRQRSVSQEPLQSEYEPPRRLNQTIHGIPRSRPRRPSLSPLKDNKQVLLRSPGPLESMLKTATETGDLGLFTIEPNVPPATYHAPPRPRPGLADADLLQSSRSKFNSNRFYPDDRKFLPSSLRYAKSDILSPYGSDSNYSRAYAPSDEDGQGLYTLSTCSSWHTPPRQSAELGQNPSGETVLQRSRTPSLYQPRLKHQPIRTTSPVFPGDGGLDQSSMVELDRAPQQASHP